MAVSRNSHLRRRLSGGRALGSAGRRTFVAAEPEAVDLSFFRGLADMLRSRRMNRVPFQSETTTPDLPCGTGTCDESRKTVFASTCQAKKPK